MNNNFLTVPYSYIQSKKLSSAEVFVLAEIISLSKLKGFCYASNGWIAKRLGFSASTVKASIAKLKKLSYVELKKDGNQRVIYADKSVNADFVLREDENQPDRGQESSPDRSKISHNNKRDNIRDKKSDNRASDIYYEIDYSKRGYDIDELEKIR